MIIFKWQKISKTSILDMMKIHYVTSNTGKFEEAALILQPNLLQKAGFELVHTPLHLEEIQGKSPEIALHKINEAYRQLGQACIIDDVSLNCPAIGGLPGPYVRSFLESIGPDGIAKLISHYDDKSCQVICHIAYASFDGHTMLFEGIVNGSIVHPRGTRLTHTHSWNAIVEPLGSNYTFAEMPLEIASTISPRYLALTQFRNHLLTI
jgi:inosine triphosphate pyrophosphatase